MECKEIQEQLLCHIDIVEDMSEDEPIKTHLLTCRACTRAYSLYRETHETLKNFGRAVRVGSVSMTPPPIPSGSTIGVWGQIKAWLTVPIPAWIPATAALILMAMFFSNMPSVLNRSPELGETKGNPTMSVRRVDLSAQSMLEFVIVPNPENEQEITASIKAVEDFLKSHPDDVAMHAKLVELCQLQLKVGKFTPAERDALTQTLSQKRKRFLELLEQHQLTKRN